MKMRIAAVSGLHVVLLAFAIGFGGIAAAEDSETESWTMPDVTGDTLQHGMDAVAGLSDSTRIPVGAIDMTRWGRQVLSPANWTVCATAPKAGESVSAEDGVLFGVVRYPSEQC